MGGMVEDLVGEVEGFQHFEGAGREAVGVAGFGGRGVLVDAEMGEGGEAEAGEEEVLEPVSECVREAIEDVCSCLGCKVQY